MCIYNNTIVPNSSSIKGSLNARKKTGHDCPRKDSFEFSLLENFKVLLTTNLFSLM